MGNTCQCETEQATLTSPIASCSIGKCKFWGETAKVVQQPTIKELVGQMEAVEIEMRRQMLLRLKAFEALSVEVGATSPEPIRIQTTPVACDQITSSS